MTPLYKFSFECNGTEIIKILPMFIPVLTIGIYIGLMMKPSKASIDKQWERNAIRHEAGRYDSATAKFEWIEPAFSDE